MDVDVFPPAISFRVLDFRGISTVPKEEQLSIDQHLEMINLCDHIAQLLFDNYSTVNLPAVNWLRRRVSGAFVGAGVYGRRSTLRNLKGIMLKTGGKDSAFGEAAQQQASAALASAADDLAMMHMLKQQQQPGSEPQGPVYIKSRKARKSDDVDGDSSDDDDDDDNDVLRGIREKRLEQLKKEFCSRQVQLSHGHGEYRCIAECDFLKEVTGSEHVVCHFFHRDFERCKIIDEHMTRIVANHPDTRFIKIDAEKSPFFVAKLAIRVLPTIVIFNDGVAVDRIVGFNDLGNKDDFPTIMLAKRLVKAGAIVKSAEHEGRNRKAKPIKTLL